MDQMIALSWRRNDGTEHGVVRLYDPSERDRAHEDMKFLAISECAAKPEIRKTYKVSLVPLA